MKYLPDINVWLALTFSAHPHHSAALAWFDSVSPGSCAFSRITQQGFLRLASNSKAFFKDALTLPKAWQAYDTLCEDERTCYLEEPPGIEITWRNFTGKSAFSAKIWNDAFLAAFAKSASLKCVTFDRGFRRYKGLQLQTLS